METDGQRWVQPGGMAVREVESPERDALVERLMDSPMRRHEAWIFEGSETADRQRYYAWLVDAALAAGRIWLSDAGGVSGGRVDPLGWHEKLRYLRLGPRRWGQRRGQYTYPDVTPECLERIRSVSWAALRMRPTGRLFLVQLIAAPEGAQMSDLWPPLLSFAGARRATPFAISEHRDERGSRELSAAGFVVCGQVPEDPEGRPALTAWART